MDDLVVLLQNVLPVVAEASRRCRVHRPTASHMWCDTCERHTGSRVSGRRYAAYANDRRFFVLDAVLGHTSDVKPTERPFIADLLAHGGGDLLEIEPGHVDVVGLDYYAHCQWHFGPSGGSAPTTCPPPLSDLMAEYAARYQRPVWLAETNLRGYPTDRATWLKYVLEQCELAAEHGVDVRGLCWFPFIDSCDWDSLLQRANCNIDPVGVFGVDASGERVESAMSASYTMAARGAASHELPAYEWCEPVASWLTGWAQQMATWERSQPPEDYSTHGIPGDPTFSPLSVRAAG